MNRQEEFKSTDELPFANKGIFTDSKFLSAIRGGANYTHETEFEGTIIFIRLLTVEETRQAEMNARQRWMKLPESIRLGVMNCHYEILEILKIALSTKDSAGKVTQRIDESELVALTEKQLLDLFKKYEDLDARYNVPLNYILEDDRYEQIIEDLEKKKIVVSNISRYELEAMFSRLRSETEVLMGNLRTLSSVDSSTIT